MWLSPTHRNTITWPAGWCRRWTRLQCSRERQPPLQALQSARLAADGAQLCLTDPYQKSRQQSEPGIHVSLYTSYRILLFTLWILKCKISLCNNLLSVCFLPQQYVPVHVLPKLEYQLSYGVECLSSSEACQLWTETMLHSSTVSYIGKTFMTVTCNPVPSNFS